MSGPDSALALLPTGGLTPFTRSRQPIDPTGPFMAYCAAFEILLRTSDNRARTFNFNRQQNRFYWKRPKPRKAQET